MPLTLKIALRFLLEKKRAMSMCLAGIIIGVSLFIVTQAQTSGFEDFFIKTIWGTDGAINVQDRFRASITSLQADPEGAGFQVSLKEGQTYVSGVEYPDRVRRALSEFSGVTGMSDVLRGNVEIISGFRNMKGEAWGIRMQDHLSVTSLASQIQFGNLDDFERIPNSILIGVKLAERLNVDINHLIKIKYLGRVVRFQVVGIFETGVEEFDKKRVFIQMNEAQRLYEQVNKVSFIQLNLKNNNDALRIAKHMEETLHHDVRPWQEEHKSWLEVFRVLRLSSAFTMSAIILIAGLGMFNTLAIVVMERRKDIAILRSIGYTQRDIVIVFLNQGLIILFVGILGGSLLGVLLTLGIESLPIRIRGIFSTDHFVVKWSIWHYFWAWIVASFVVSIAAYLPARKAAKIEPGAIIRGTGG